MDLFEMLIDTQAQQAIASRIYGVVVGVVTNNKDPNNLGRVKVKFPWLSDADESHWARIATPMAGKQRGIYFLPEIDDEVLVVFEQGDVRFPYIIGSLWNGKDTPPETNKTGKNDIRLIKSRSGHVIRLNDEKGKETIEIIDKTNKNSIKFETATNTISITSDKDITLSAPRGIIKLDAKEIDIQSSARTNINAKTQMDLKATAEMNIKGAIINLN
ncbi:phage baseplate assembly protein V [Floridanema aerugineum]|uniref:Phage baseplate assembly protein V n=1 Tax=Floridaenema aerugineum BLCC-F46 TaxID=3153654 RepID=A0ABV4WXY7_9CYAN